MFVLQMNLLTLQQCTSSSSSPHVFTLSLQKGSVVLHRDTLTASQTEQLGFNLSQMFHGVIYTHEV